MPTLDWLTRSHAVKSAEALNTRLLEPVPEFNYGDPESANLLIQGDNLEALQALRPLYAGRVKCIYIDPPFNTQQAFDHYDDNLEHSLWLDMMYPRLELLRELLSDDGALFVHIDDNQIAYLTVLLDEIFGRKNRTHIVSFKQASATGHKAINPGMVNTCNFILSYAKDKDRWSPNRVFTERNRDPRYSQFIVNPDDSPSEWHIIPVADAFAQHRDMPKRDLRRALGDTYEDELTAFVVEHATHVIRTARPDYRNVGSDVREAIDRSIKKPDEVVLHRRRDAPDMYLRSGERILFYRDKLREIDGRFVTGEPLTTLWSDLLSNNLHNEGGVSFPKGKKPEGLVKRILDLTTEEGDLVLDSFLGSGTTAAVAHKMGRRYIGVELGDHAITHCAPRLQSVVDGDQSGISRSVQWEGGGGYRFYRLGGEVFDTLGGINADVSFEQLARHIWYVETLMPLDAIPDSPLIGVHGGTAYYLLYNGILGDRRPNGGNVLTSRTLATLPAFGGPKVVYGESTRLGPARLAAANVTFKQLPYDAGAR